MASLPDIILTGFMATGKSATGKKLAAIPRRFEKTGNLGYCMVKVDDEDRIPEA